MDVDAADLPGQGRVAASAGLHRTLRHRPPPDRCAPLFFAPSSPPALTVARSPPNARAESYNHFIEHMLPMICQENSDITTMSADGATSHHLHFVNVTVLRPTVRESDGFERPIVPHVARCGA